MYRVTLNFCLTPYTAFSLVCKRVIIFFLKSVLREKTGLGEEGEMRKRILQSKLIMF